MYLYGASGHAKVIIDILRANNEPIEALFDDNEKIHTLFDYPVLRSSEVCGPLIISIGNNGVRRKIAEKLQVEYGRVFHPSAIISEKAIIKEGTVVMQGAINGFGTKIVIAHTTARKISEIYFLPISVFGSAAATMAGQNYGAGNIKRVKQTIWKATLLTWGWSALMTVVTFLFTPQLANLITGITDNEILKIVGIMISEPLVWIGMAVILGIGFIVTLRRNRVIIRR